MPDPFAPEGHLDDFTLRRIFHYEMDLPQLMAKTVHLFYCGRCAHRFEELFPGEGAQRIQLISGASGWRTPPPEVIPPPGVVRLLGQVEAMMREWSTELVAGEIEHERLEGLTPAQAQLLAQNRKPWRVGTVTELLKEVERLWFEDPHEALGKARVARTITYALEGNNPVVDFYLPELKAEVEIYLANSLRVAGDFLGAEGSFEEARGLLVACGRPVRWVALYQNCMAALRLDQERFEEALELNRLAIDSYRSAQDLQGSWIVLQRQTRILCELGHHASAIEGLKDLCSEIEDSRGDLGLLFRVRQNLVLAYLEAGEPFAAAASISKLRELAQAADAGEMDLVKVDWLEGRIAEAEGELALAEGLYRKVRSRYIQKALVYDAALVCLDLAALLVRRGDDRAALRLAGEMETLFELEGLHPDAATTLRSVSEALSSKAATAAMLLDAAAQLQTFRATSPGNGA